MFNTLCDGSSFAGIDRNLFIDLLRDLGRDDAGMIEQAPDGTLLLGAKGERLVEHYGFYAVFQTPDEYRVVAAGKTLGTLPIGFVLTEGMTIVFSGRRWRILAVRDDEKVLEVVPDPTGKPPQFGGDACDLHDTVVGEMQRVLSGNDMPPYLDSRARELLLQGRAAFKELQLTERSLVAAGEDLTLAFPWRGTIATETLALALRSYRLDATPFHAVVEIKNPIGEVEDALADLARNAPPSSTRLASFIKVLQREKFHPYLSREMLIADAASARIGADAVPVIAKELLTP